MLEPEPIKIFYDISARGFTPRAHKQINGFHGLKNGFPIVEAFRFLTRKPSVYLLALATPTFAMWQKCKFFTLHFNQVKGA